MELNFAGSILVADLQDLKANPKRPAIGTIVEAELDKINPGYELTFCSTGATGYYDVAGLTAPGAADAVFIMGYDFRGGGSAYAGSIDPLTSPKPVYDLTQVIHSWAARTAVSKIILGLPYYGIAWTTTTNSPYGTVVKNSCIAPTSVFFAQAASLAAAHGRNYDSVEQSAWTSYQLTCPTVAVTVWRELYYDDAQSLAAKYDMINYWNLRGAGIWALGEACGTPFSAPRIMEEARALARHALSVALQRRASVARWSATRLCLRSRRGIQRHSS